MYVAIILSSLLVVGFGLGPMYPPTSGHVWPKPFSEKKQQIALNVVPEKITFEVTENDCELVQKAIDRCKNVLLELWELVKWYGYQEDEEFISKIRTNNILEVHITIKEPCEKFPHDEMNESYSLIVSEKVELKSESVWGTIRGLETLSQLFYVTPDFEAVKINATEIEDKPNFPYRGYLLDTSRHYIRPYYIIKTLDAMAMNKLNVFHWHIIDDNSFPYHSHKFPELSYTAAYHSSMVYTRSLQRYILNHARDLGIRVIMEFDVPGHSDGYKISHPEIMTKCTPNVYSNPMNPVKNETYEILQGLFEEVQNRFPDNHFHTGGDEVYASCWNQDPDIKEYMKTHNINDVNEIRILFYQRMLPLLKDGTVPLFWEDVFAAKVPLPSNSIIQVWQSDKMLVDVLKSGLRGIQSYYYYLDQMNTGFDGYYVDPRVEARKKLDNETLLNNILGGTACMWGEMADDSNVLSRSWPRASAMAETLWSHTNGEKSADIYNRIEEHVCRMYRRGINAQPAKGPGFCVRHGLALHMD